MFSCKFCQISKNTFLHRTPMVAASGFGKFGSLEISHTTFVYFLMTFENPYSSKDLEIISILL